jgi:ABC-type amino acid transport substrate-binding protein
VETTRRFRSTGGRASRFDIEIALEMARSLERPVEWVPFAWPELGARVKENAFHVAMSGITWAAPSAPSSAI